jgi:hypothetical protein
MRRKKGRVVAVDEVDQIPKRMTSLNEYLLSRTLASKRFF